MNLLGFLITIVVAALFYWLCLALGLPYAVGLIVAILIVLAGVPTGGFGLGARANDYWDRSNR